MNQPARVLVIDDDEGTCDTLADVLRLRGSSVETATAGRAGLSLLAARRPDVAIVDIKLPDISGLELLAAIKAASPETEVIFLTGYPSLPTAIQAINGAAFAYLTKPCEMEHLLATLNSAIEKQRLMRALRANAKIFRASPAALGFGNLEGRLMEVNEQFVELVGYPEGELVGQPMSLLWASAEDGEHVIHVLQERGWVRDLEARFRRKSGEYLDVLARAESVDVSGQRAFILMLSVLKERKKAEEMLRQSEKLAGMGQLLAAVAHELNNPLTVVLGYATLLHSSDGTKSVAERATKITEAAERCSRIVRDFLTLAREHPPERNEVQLNDVVREVADLLAHHLHTDAVDVTFELASDLPSVWGDRHQLYQVVVNLVTNAHEAMRQSASRRHLTLATRVDSARTGVALEVSDTGPGMSPEVQARVFEPFFTTKPLGDGTGLGLALCQGIVKVHGGVIRVESRPGRGATFLVDLPVDLRRASRLRTPAVPSGSSGRGRTILVVDDEPGIGDVLSAILVAGGHHVDTAANGAIALEKLSQRTYDVILSDLRMPELDGPSLYREIERRQPDLCGRFVILTGDLLSPETRTFLDEAGVRSLSKPFGPGELRRLVEQIPP